MTFSSSDPLPGSVRVFFWCPECTAGSGRERNGPNLIRAKSASGCRPPFALGPPLFPLKSRVGSTTLKRPATSGFQGRNLIKTTKWEVMSTPFIQRFSIASALALNLTVGSAASAAGTASGYSWTEISIPSIGPLGLAFGPNDKGQVAVSNADGTKSGIYRNGVFTPLPPPPAGYTVSATGINNAGVITGSAIPSSDPTSQRGFILIGSNYTLFAQPGWAVTSPRAIANSGLITGSSASADLSTNAGFIYDPRTNTFTDATPPGSGTGFSVTQGMNAEGRISGDGRLSGLGRYGFVWQQGALVEGKRELAPFLARFTIGDGQTAARGINDAGTIVGFTALAGTLVGFVGSDSRGFRVLVPPGGDAAGASVSCEGINNALQVVCNVTDAAGNVRNFIGSPEE
jgi:hypothetical protein